MKIKRFFSQDMRSAIRMVRDELGSDAVILSNSKVNGGIEVVAAIDYDESLFDTDASYGTAEDSQRRNSPTPYSQNPNVNNQREKNHYEQNLGAQNQSEQGNQSNIQIDPHQLHAVSMEQQGRAQQSHSQQGHNQQSGQSENVLQRNQTVHTQQAAAPMVPENKKEISPTNVSNSVSSRQQKSTFDELDYAEGEYDSEYENEAENENWAYELINPTVNHLQQSKLKQNKINEAFNPQGSQLQSPYLKYRIGDNSTMEDWPVLADHDDFNLDMPDIDAETFSQFISEARPKPKQMRNAVVPNDSIKSSPARPETYRDPTLSTATGSNRVPQAKADSLGRINGSSQPKAAVVQAHNETPQRQGIRTPMPAKQTTFPELAAMRTEITNLRGMLEEKVQTTSPLIEMERNNPIQARVLRQLLEMEISPAIIDQITAVIQPGEDFQSAWQAALALLAKHIPVSDDDLVAKGGIVSLVGSTGVGKTTTVAKLAARYAMRHGRDNVALITTDNYRIGALEQLRTYGKILGIPVKIANNKKQLEENLKHIAHKKFILIDTAGMSQRDVRLMEQFSLISECAPTVKNYLVMSTTTQKAALDEIIRTFSNIKIAGGILTKVDETTNLGCALSVMAQHNIPITYISDGQKVPEDLHLARTHMLINRALLIAKKMSQSARDNADGYSGNNYANA